MNVKLFADGADLEHILRLAADERIRGFTTNPTLMWKAGLTDYSEFCHRLLAEITDRPISFEVFADDAGRDPPPGAHARRLGRERVREGAGDDDPRRVARAGGARSGADGVQVNVTALFTPRQVSEITAAVADGAPSCISVFAGRIADTGRDPVPIMREALEIMRAAPRAELIWASPRELLNVVQADAIGCHIITCTSDVLAKLGTLGKDLDAVLAGDGPDVPPRRDDGRVHAVKRVLITGGAGFIGSNLADRAASRDVEVAILDNFSTGRRELVNPGAELFEGDVLDTERAARSHARAATPSSTCRPTPTCATGWSARAWTSSRTRSRPRTCSRRCGRPARTRSRSPRPARSTASPRCSRRPRTRRSRSRRRCTPRPSSRGRG